MKIFSIIVIPIFILFVVLYGFRKKIDIYSSFLNGAKDGLKTVYNIFPAVLAMVFAVNIFLDSNVLLFLGSFGSSVGAIRLLVVVLLFGSKSLRVTVML